MRKFNAMCKVDYRGFKKDQIYYCKSKKYDGNKTVITIKDHRYEFFYGLAFYECFYTEKEYRLLKLKNLNEKRYKDFLDR